MLRTAVPIIVLAFLVLLIPVFGWWLLQRPLPPMNGQEFIPKLNRSVTVSFDGHAVPYISGDSEADVFAVQGYITARDRMFQMDMARRAATGMMSDVFGSSALPSDRLVRSIGITKIAQAELEVLEPQAKTALDSYTRGVNAYLSEYFDRLPLEFALLGYKPQPWQQTDSLAILKYSAYLTDESWRLDDLRQRVVNKVGEKLARELFHDGYAQFVPLPVKQETKSPTTSWRVRGKNPDFKPGRPGAAVDALLARLQRESTAMHKFSNPRPSWGSTAVAVPGRVSESNGALLSADKHGAFTSPSDWYLCSLKSPGLHVAGATMPGVPGVIVGRNDSIAWGSASLKADVQDLYVEQFKSQFDRAYKISPTAVVEPNPPATPTTNTDPGPGWEDAQETVEVIPVRFGADVEHKVLTTRHGPVLLRSDETAIALAWQGADPSKPAFNAIYQLNHATDWDAFIRAISVYADPPQLFVFADRFGNAGIRAAGEIPTRSKSNTGLYVNDGWQSKNSWTGTVPFDKLPEATISADSTKVAQMCFVAANQKLAAKAPLPVLKPGVYIGNQWSPPYRANRLLWSMTEQQSSSLQALNQLQADKLGPLAALIQSEVKSALVQLQSIDRYQISAAELLSAWDGQLSSHSAAASVYEAFVQTSARRLIEPKLGRDMTNEYLDRWALWPTFVENFLRNKPQQWLPPEERTHSAFIATTLAQSMKSMKIAFGTNDPGKWLWGEAHQARFRHVIGKGAPWLSALFDIGPINMGGSSDTVDSADVKSNVSSLVYPSESGSTQRLVIDMADFDKFYQSISTGQSGHLFSPYRTDQLKSWLRADPFPIAFSDNQINKQAKSRLVIGNR
jgi:penicillin G amidase